MANIRPLPPALLEAAKNELHEDPARLEADLQHLREWVAKQPHLRARTDDQFLVAFLRGTKFSLERAKEKLDAYYTLRTAVPEVFSKRDPTKPSIQKLVKMGIVVPLGTDKEGRRVILARSGIEDPNEFSPEVMFQMNTMLTEMMILEDDSIMVKGQVAVMDVKHITLAHTIALSPSFMKKTMTIFQEGYPIRLKAFHYLNVGSIVETLFGVFKSFLKDKLKKRINIHANLESLYEQVPREILPEEYGGDAGPILEIADRWNTKLMQWKDYFEEDDKYGVDEKKRPGRPKTHADLFGLEGSFRPLNVD